MGRYAQRPYRNLMLINFVVILAVPKLYIIYFKLVEIDSAAIEDLKVPTTKQILTIPIIIFA